MKTILLLNNIFSADMIKDFDYLKSNLDMKKFNLISPIMFMVKDNKYDDKDFTLKIIASAISLGNMYNDFGTIKSITQQDKITIYYGLAHLNVKYDDVYCINKIALDAQEFFMDDFLKKNEIKFDYIHSAKSSKDFNNMSEAVVYLNAL